MNIKKIGMTALAASLVSVSANAVDMTVSGGASINANQYSGTDLDYGSSFTMGNAIKFTASGETESGLNVAVSFELDEGANSGNRAQNKTTSSGSTNVDGSFGQASSDVFDNHSVSVGNDTLGTLIFSGHGGNSATTKINTTAAGDIWDSFDGTLMSTVATGVTISEAGAGDDSFFYTAPSLMDGLDVFASYNPSNTTETDESAIGYGVTYTGVDGLTVSYAQADVKTNSSATSGENTAISAKYAYGPVTVAYTINEHDEGDNTNDQDTTSYAVSYTLTEEISVSYGVEELERGGGSSSVVDAEYSKISASYTSGGVTLSAAYSEADNIDYSNNANADQEYIFLGASFAF